jgi:hypothetical protein
MQKFEYCAVYQIAQMGGWLTSVGMAYKEEFTERGATRLDIDHNPDALAKIIAGLGKEGWEMVGTGVVTEHYHALYFKRPIEG